MEVTVKWLEALLQTFAGQEQGKQGLLLRAMRRKGYHVDRGEGELNIVYVRGENPNFTPNDNAPDLFNDLRIVFGTPQGARIWACTVDPGNYYRQHPINSEGWADIKPGQYRAWQVGMHRGDHEALVQTGGPVTVFRTPARISPVDVREDSGWFGINQHGPSRTHGEQSHVGVHSAGCLVAQSMEQHADFMALVKTDRRYIANPRFVYTSTILEAKDLY